MKHINLLLQIIIDFYNSFNFLQYKPKQIIVNLTQEKIYYKNVLFAVALKDGRIAIVSSLLKTIDIILVLIFQLILLRIMNHHPIIFLNLK